MSIFTNRVRAGLAIALALFIVSPSLSPVRAAPGAVLSGRVLQADGVTPRTGVVVTLFDVERRVEFPSDPTNAEGVFKIDTAPPGSYTVLARTAEGVFLAADGFVLVPGENRPLALTLQVAPGEAPRGLAAQGAGLPVWAKGIIIGVIGVGALLVIDEVTEDTEPCASPPCN